jgi:1-deoxy-D-xylulose-5-phosphate synthase
MVSVFEQAKSMKGPVLVHVSTVKGKGYKFAEEQPALFHGIAPFEIETGQVIKSGSQNYCSVFGEKLCELAKNDESIVAITAAMTDGTGLGKFRDMYPKRFFDVGIAEQHAVTLAAGLAMGGVKPVVAIYSTFLQRAYDQILHDVALQNLNVVFGIDRAGVIGDDGETHQGIYDVSYLYTIPYLSILSPASPNELKSMMDYALTEHHGPIALRYPRGSGCEFEGSDEPVVFGKGIVLREGTDITLIGAGSMMNITLEAANLLSGNGVSCEVINPRFLRPVDDELILASARKTGHVVIVQDVIQNGGFGAYVTGLLNDSRTGARAMVLGLPDRGIEHGERSLIYKMYGLDAQGITAVVLSEIGDIPR